MGNIPKPLFWVPVSTTNYLPIMLVNIRNRRFLKMEPWICRHAFKESGATLTSFDNHLRFAVYHDASWRVSFIARVKPCSSFVVMFYGFGKCTVSKNPIAAIILVYPTKYRWASSKVSLVTFMCRLEMTSYLCFTQLFDKKQQ